MSKEPQFGPGPLSHLEMRETLDAWIEACGEVTVEIDPDYPIPYYAALPGGRGLISLPPGYTLEQYLHEAAHHCDRAGLASLLKGIAQGRIRVERLARMERAREEASAKRHVHRWKGLQPPDTDFGPPRIPTFTDPAEHRAWIEECIALGRRSLE